MRASIGLGRAMSVTNVETTRLDNRHRKWSRVTIAKLVRTTEKPQNAGAPDEITSVMLEAGLKAYRDRDSRVQHDWEVVEDIYFGYDQGEIRRRLRRYARNLAKAPA
jgi:hypothetical protein